MSSSFPRWLLVSASALVVVVGLASGAWWYTHRPVAQHLTLFYADSQGMILVPVESNEPFERPDAPGVWAHALFDRLAHTPNAKLIPPVGPKMALVDASWMAPTWSLTVKLPNESGTTEETLLAGSLVRSFVASYPGAEKVRLRLVGPDGKPFMGQHLDLGDALTPADFANRAETPPNAGLSATLWWCTRGGTELVPVQLPLGTGSGSPPHDAFDRLLAGPPKQANTFLDAVAPPGLKAHWAGLDGDIAHIDFDTDPPTDAAGERFVKATVLTLTEFPAVKQVRFTRHAVGMAAKVGAYDLSRPVPRPANVNAGGKRSETQGG